MVSHFRLGKRISALALCIMTRLEPRKYLLVFKHGLHLQTYILEAFVFEFGNRARTDKVEENGDVASRD